MLRALNLALEPLPEPRLDTDVPLPPEDRIRSTDGAELVEIGSIYRARAAKLQRYFARRADAQDATDLVQESFARLAGALVDARRSPKNPAAYLSQIATNLVRDRARAAYQRAISTSNENQDEFGSEDPLATLEARDILRRVEQSLTKLKPLTRDIFLAHRRDGLSYREIAGLTGLTNKGVEWHMSKAISHVTRALGR